MNRKDIAEIKKIVEADEVLQRYYMKLKFEISEDKEIIIKIVNLNQQKNMDISEARFRLEDSEQYREMLSETLANAGYLIYMFAGAIVVIRKAL
jgi:hypothetical protein